MNTGILIASCIVNTIFTVCLLIYLLYLKILSERVDRLEEWRDLVHEMRIRDELKKREEKTYGR